MIALEAGGALDAGQNAGGRRTRRDDALRRAVHDRLRSPGRLVLDEVGVWMGASVVDVAALGPDGFVAVELKSDADDLRRLPGQIHVAGLAFDRVVAACAPGLAGAALAAAPGWAGVWEVGGGGVRELRPAMASPILDPAVMASLLWRPEAARALRALGARPRGRRPELWRELAARAGPDGLRALILEALRARGAWVRQHTRA